MEPIRLQSDPTRLQSQPKDLQIRRPLVEVSRPRRGGFMIPPPLPPPMDPPPATWPKTRKNTYIMQKHAFRAGGWGVSMSSLGSFGALLQKSRTLWPEGISVCGQQYQTLLLRAKGYNPFLVRAKGYATF